MSGEGGEGSASKIKRSTVSAWMWYERVAKIATAFVIPMILWAISVQIFISQGPRVTPKDLELSKKEVLEEVDKRFDTLPPQSFREKVDKIEKLAEENNEEIQELKLAVARVDTNVANILRILDE